MTTREVLASVLLALAAELTLLAVFVFLGEPHDTGRTATRFEAVDIAYLAVPLALVAAAVAIPCAPSCETTPRSADERRVVRVIVR